MTDEIMRTFNDNFSRLDLKCNFPARNSFRETLLERLRIMEEQHDRQTTSTEGDVFLEECEARALSDDELEMLAAAQGPLEKFETNLRSPYGPSGQR